LFWFDKEIHAGSSFCVGLDKEIYAGSPFCHGLDKEILTPVTMPVLRFLLVWTTKFFKHFSPLEDFSFWFGFQIEFRI
jgi:hypothetical protein